MLRSPAPLGVALLVAAAAAAPTPLTAQDAPDDEAAQAVQADSAAAPTSLQQTMAEIERLRARIAEVEENLAGASAPLATLFEFQRRERWIEHHAAVSRLVSSIRSEGSEVDSAAVSFARDAVLREIAAATAWTEEVRTEAVGAMESLMSASPETLVEREIELSRLNEGLDQLMAALTDDYDFAETLDLDLAEQSAAHDSALVARAELLGASLEFSNRQVAELRGWRGKPGIDSVTVNFRLAAQEERLVGTTASLQRIVELLERRNVDTAHFRRLIVASSGTISTDVLDRRVLGGLLAQWGEQLAQWVRDNVGSVLLRLLLIAVVVLAASRLSGIVSAGVRRGIRRLDLSSLIKNLVVTGAGKLVWVLALFVVLGIAGVDLGPMLAGLGIVGFVVGFALQETLANFASGVMIMVYRPFDVGDLVTTAGVTGKVKDLTLVSTVVQTFDNKRIIIPNGKVWGDVINNATAEHTRRVDLVFGISYGDDIDHARSVLEDILASDERVLDDPAPMVRVDSLGDSSVNLFCRPWCKTEDYWDVYWDIPAVVKKRFDAEGITIPFPQRDVHLHGQPGQPASG